MKRSLISAGAIAVGSALALTSSAVAAGPSLSIRHELRGCHGWSLNGDAYGAAQVLRTTAGSALTVSNFDVMPHRLVQTSGPAARITNVAPARTPGPMMGHPSSTAGMMGFMGAKSRVVFPRAGVYRFTTKAGEDYMRGVKTIGEDNTLLLTVVVR
jgi:hypothetical protein